MMGEECPPYYGPVGSGPGSHPTAEHGPPGAFVLSDPYISPPQFNLLPDGSYGCELILYDGDFPITRGTGVGLTRKTARKIAIASVVKTCSLPVEPRERGTSAPKSSGASPFAVEVMTGAGPHLVPVPVVSLPGGPLNPTMAGAAIFGACALMWPGAPIRLMSLRHGKTVGGMGTAAAEVVLATAKAAAKHKSGIEER